ncbi:creatininase family protein [Flindersiella endophytica]
MTTLRWQELDRETLRELLPEALVVLPIGATEQHGPHLATGTDALLAGTVAERAIARMADSPRPLILAPTIPVGASDHHLPFSGTLSLRVETLLDLLLDLARSVAACGGQRMVIVNGHGGNRGVCSAAAAAASTRHDIAVAYLDYWSLIRGTDAAADDVNVPGHAGEFETSLVMAVDPALVKDRTERDIVPAQPAVDSVEIAVQSAWTVIQGFTDDPARATAVQGQAWLDHLSVELSTRLVQLAKTL